MGRCVWMPPCHGRHHGLGTWYNGESIGVQWRNAWTLKKGMRIPINSWEDYYTVCVPCILQSARSWTRVRWKSIKSILSYHIWSFLSGFITWAAKEKSQEKQLVQQSTTNGLQNTVDIQVCQVRMSSTVKGLRLQCLAKLLWHVEHCKLEWGTQH